MTQRAGRERQRGRRGARDLLGVVLVCALVSACSKTTAPSVPVTDAAEPEEVRLTWTLGPILEDGEAGVKRTLDLEVRVGTEVRRHAFGVQQGDLVGEEQSVCSPSLRSGRVVSLLDFRTFGRRTLSVKRARPDAVEIWRFVDADPEELDMVVTFQVPAGARVTESLVDVRDEDDVRPFDCARGSSLVLPAEGAVVTVSKSAKLLDAPGWRAAAPGSTLSLRWTVDRSRAKPPLPQPLDDAVDLTTHEVPVTLSMTLAGESHVLELEANAAPPSSDTCGQVSFYWAGLSVPLSIARAEGGKVVVMKTAKQRYVFDLPSRVTVKQEIVELDAGGATKVSTTKCVSSTL